MRIKLLRMRLKNFMCYETAEFDFSDRTLICGANGHGKSSIASAYTWALFDCDYSLKSSPAVRREINGEPDMDSDVEVSLTFDVDGKEVTMSKVQKRKYSKDGETYKDDNKYFINDVSKTKKEFDAYLEIDAKVFKACSNIDWFISQKPEEMRAYLFGLVEDVSDIDVCKTSPDLAGLETELEKYTAEELDAMSKKRLADANKELPVLKGRIKEKTEELKQRSEFDYAELELKRNGIKEKIAENRKKQADNQKILDEYDSAMESVMQLKFQLSGLQNEANEKLNEKKRALNMDISKLRADKSACEAEISICHSKANGVKSEIMNAETNRNMLTAQWRTEKARAFDEGSLNCPYCGRELPKDEQERLKAEFKQKQETRIAEITEKGLACKAKIESLQAVLDKYEQEAADFEPKLEAMDSKIKMLIEQLNGIPSVANVQDNDEYKNIAIEIAEKEAAIGSARNITELKEQLKGEEDSLNEELRSVERILDWANTEEIEKRLEELTARRTNLEQGKADAERILYLLDELKKAKNDMFSEKINKHFDKVKWKLFDYAKNGNYKSVCVPQMDGKSILTTISNKGNRILGKVDICRSIQKIEGASLPIWLDDSESLDAENRKKVSEMVASQLIMLIVNDNTELKVEG